MDVLRAKRATPVVSKTWIVLDPTSFDWSRVKPINKEKPLGAQIFHV